MFRSGTNTTIPLSTLGTSYVAATSAALTAALGLNSLTKNLPPLVGRLVPFCAVAVANSVNIPLMRRLELQDGIMLETEEGKQVGQSKIAAKTGITMVVTSRIGMAAPGKERHVTGLRFAPVAVGMVLIPLVMNKLESRGFFKKFPRANAPLQVLMVGFILTFATPLCCAIFEQKASIKVSDIEDELQEKVKKMGITGDQLYYNKGL